MDNSNYWLSWTIQNITIVCNPSLLSKKKKVADMLNKHQKMFVGLADRVAREQWQSMELQIEKAFSLKESHAEICHQISSHG